MLTDICDFNRSRHGVWDDFNARTTIAIVMGGALFLLCACAQQTSPTLPPTDPAPSARAAVPTRTTLPIPTYTPSPSPPPSIAIAIEPTGEPLTTTLAVADQGPSDADLAIQIPGPVPIVPGETSIYTLTIRNHGPDPATGIVLTDVLPAGVMPVWAQSAQPLCGRQERNVSCDVGELWPGDTATVILDLSVGGTETLITGTQLAGVTWDLSAPTCAIGRDSTPPHVTCRLATLQPGADARMRIGVGVDARITGTLAHTATVAANEADPNRSNNRAALTMTAGPSTSLPSAALGTGGTGAAGPVLPVPSGDEGPLSVTAVPTTTDLVLQADGPSSVIAGQPFTYTFTITNQGALDATGVRFEDVLPLATTLNAYAPGLPLCEQRDDALTCTLRDLDSGESITFTLVITGHAGQPMVMEPDAVMPGWPVCSVLKERTYLYIVNCEFGVLKPSQATHAQLVLTAGGVRERAMVNAASVWANEAERNPLDNTNTTTITVQTRADLSVRSAISGPAVAGKTLSYTLTVANAGPSDASDVVLADTLPTGTRLVSAVPSLGGNCGIEREETSTDTVICSLARLSGGGEATVTIVVEVDVSLTPAQARTIVHSARVVAAQPDPYPSNNRLAQTIPVSDGTEE
jgi:uncharacterized repeat protein (TIGR01451 family)